MWAAGGMHLPWWRTYVDKQPRSRNGAREANIAPPPLNFLVYFHGLNFCCLGLFRGFLAPRLGFNCIPAESLLVALTLSDDCFINMIRITSPVWFIHTICSDSLEHNTPSRIHSIPPLSFYSNHSLHSTLAI